MGTVLEKPVLLDETGQAIVNKLDDIKNAIDNGGTEKYPVLIYIDTQPTKTSYIAGEQLNLAGMVVKAVFSNNVEYDVTGQCTFSPANGTVLSSANTSITATYTWHPTSTAFTATQSISVKTPTGLTVTTQPTKTEYIKGETLDLTGIVVEMGYADSESEDVTSDCIFSPTNGSILNDTTLEAINISYTLSGTVYTTTQAISVIAPIYGVSWDGTSSSTWTRTDMAADFTDPVPQMSDGNNGWTEGSSPFDDVMPWSGIKRVEDSDLGILVEIPKFYYKLTLDGYNVRGIQISSAPLEGFSVSPAHADRGDGQGERDKVYVGAYHNSSNHKSETGQQPYTNVNRTSIRSWIRSLGNGAYLWDIQMMETIWMLYLVEFADTNSQLKIGYGCSDSGAKQATGLTDLMPYHTGTTKTNRTSYGHIKYRWIEDLWGNVFDWFDGAYLAYQINTYKLMVKNDPSSYSDSDGVQTECGMSSGYSPLKQLRVSLVSGAGWLIWPHNGMSGASNDSYLCDGQSTTSNQNDTSLLTGGSYDRTDTYGLFYIKSRSSGGDATVGSRLMKLPANA